MTPFSHFTIMAWSLAILAGCALVTTLKQFGFWRWAGSKITGLGNKVMDWLVLIR